MSTPCTELSAFQVSTLLALGISTWSLKQADLQVVNLANLQVLDPTPKLSKSTEKGLLVGIEESAVLRDALEFLELSFVDLEAVTSDEYHAYVTYPFSITLAQAFSVSGNKLAGPFNELANHPELKKALWAVIQDRQGDFGK